MALRACKGIADRCKGLWDFFIMREHRRRDVELERERNAGTKSAIEALPRGAELIEFESGGRSRLIRIPDGAPATRNVIAQREDRRNAGELSS